MKAIARARMMNASRRLLAVVANRLERHTKHGARALSALQAGFGDILATTLIPKAAGIAFAMKSGCPLDDKSHVAAIVSSLANELLAKLDAPAFQGHKNGDCIECVAVNEFAEPAVSPVGGGS